MPLVKICGITNQRDAVAAAEAGADAVGFICDPGSSRYVSPETFLQASAMLPRRITRVGVFFRSHSPEWTRAGRSVLAHFDRIQYGEDAVWSQVVKENWDMRRKIRSFHLQDVSDLLAIAAYNGLTMSYLVNVHVATEHSRRDGDSRGYALAKQVHQFGKRLYLAGGLTPANVATAISAVMPYAVDVNVGVESHPGYKDATKIRDFVQAVRSGVNQKTPLND